MNRFRLLKLRSSRALSALALGACGLVAHADDTAWQTHGALTQGITYTSDNNYFGPSDDDASLEFTEISLNFSGRLLQNLRAAGQALYRHVGAQSDGAAADYLFLDYQFFTNSSLITGVRAGRFKVPLGLYNETRDVASTRPSIYLPSIYPDIARDLELSGDGALLYGEFFTNSGTWSAEFGIGQPRLDDRTMHSVFGFLPGEPSNVETHKSMAWRAMYQSSDGAWIAAFSQVAVHADYQQALTSTFSTPVNLDLVYSIGSLQYNLDKWTFTGEYGQIDANLKLRALNTEQKFFPCAYYIQATRRLDEQWSVYGRWDDLFWDRKDRSGNDFADVTGRENFANFSYDNTLGVRFDFNNNMMVSAEYHYIEGTALLSVYDNPDPESTTKYWNMVTMEFSYRF